MVENIPEGLRQDHLAVPASPLPSPIPVPAWFATMQVAGEQITGMIAFRRDGDVIKCQWFGGDTVAISRSLMRDAMAPDVNGDVIIRLPMDTGTLPYRMTCGPYLLTVVAFDDVQDMALARYVATAAAKEDIDRYMEGSQQSPDSEINAEEFVIAQEPPRDDDGASA